MRALALLPVFVSLAIPLSAQAAGRAKSSSNGVTTGAAATNANATPNATLYGDATPNAPATTTTTAATTRTKPAPEASEDEETGPSERGFSMGVRFGYALAMGSLAKDANLNGATDMTKWVNGNVPIIGDVGYRITKKFYVGGYFKFAFNTMSGDFCTRFAGTNSCSSSGTNIGFGAMARYTFSPDARFSPWLGGSFGYEILNLSASYGNSTWDATARGLEFLGLHFGVDYAATPDFKIGPLVSFGMGEYTSYDNSQQNSSSSGDFTKTSIHEWLFFGIRGQYDL